MSASIRNFPTKIRFLCFSYEDQPSLIPGPFDTTGGDGGGFFSGVEDNAYRSFATSWTHLSATT